MTIDPRAVVVGAAVAIGVAVPPVLVYQALYNAHVIAKESSWALVFYALAMVGFTLGGFVAGSKRPDTPLTHGAVASFAAFASVQLIAAVVVVVRGDTPSLVKIVFNAMLAAGLGVLGGLLSTRRVTAA